MLRRSREQPDAIRDGTGTLSGARRSVESGVGTVAARGVSSALALAEGLLLRRLRDELEWSELAASVRAVAEGLVLGLPAAAPPVRLPLLEIDDRGPASGDDGFTHSLPR